MQEEGTGSGKDLTPPKKKIKFECRSCGGIYVETLDSQFPCPHCGYDPTKKEGEAPKGEKGKVKLSAKRKDWILFGIYVSILFLLPFILVRSGITVIHSIMYNALLEAVGQGLATVIMVLPYVIILAVDIWVALILSKYNITEPKGATIVGSSIILYFLVLGIVGGQIPLPGIGGIVGENLPFKGCDMGCYFEVMATNPGQNPIEICCEQEEEGPEYVGSKNHNMLGISLGKKHYTGSGDYRLDIKTAYAYWQDSTDKEEYELIFNIENLGEDEREEKGVTLNNVYVDYVYAYKDRKREGDEHLFEFENFDIFDKDQPPRGLEPEDEYEIRASEFTGTSSIDHETITFSNYIPCEIEDLDRLQFEVGINYDLKAEHERALIVARSVDDEDVIHETADLKDALLSKAPSDGPLDLLIDFNQNPYPLGDRPIDQIIVSVWIMNEEIDGEYKPKTLTLDIEGKKPDWLQVENSIGCPLSGDFRLSSQFTRGGSKEYKCTFKFDTSKYPSDDAYQKINLMASLEYEYKQIFDDFTSSSQMAKVDREKCENRV